MIIAIPITKKTGSLITKFADDLNRSRASPSWIPRTTLCGTHLSMISKKRP